MFAIVRVFIFSFEGAVLVTTPQDVALADVTRGAQMFQKVGKEATH